MLLIQNRVVDLPRKFEVFFARPFTKKFVCTLLKDMRNPLIECLPGDSFSSLSRQGLLELLWTVYSEEKLQSCLKLRNFQNPFNKDKSVGL